MEHGYDYPVCATTVKHNNAMPWKMTKGTLSSLQERAFSIDIQIQA
jgi:hypothetical protein